jgi:NADH dehydrogenase
MGVTIITKTFVKTYDGEVLELSNGTHIASKTVIWAAGVIGNTIKGLPETVIKAGQRMHVNRMNLIEGLEDVYAIGDIAYMETTKYPKGHPQLANVAINQAKNLASNLAKISRGKQLKEFEYKDLGSMATIGKNKAVVDLPFYKFKGYFAWLTWMFLHLMLILSVRNKLIIFINWAWAYISRDSSLWLILKKDKSE